MTTILKSGLPIGELKQQLDNLLKSKPKGIDTSKYCGVLKTEIDPIEYQRRIRNEWN